MSLQVAPCPKCRQAVVYGERHCRACGEPFAYGQAAPPQPTAAQIGEALLAVGAPILAAAAGPVAQTVSPVSNPPASHPPAPRQIGQGPSDPMIETGRADIVGAVATEAIPGFIDSRLFGAMVPKEVAVEVMPGIERTQVAGGDRPPAPDPTMQMVLDTGRYEEITMATTTSAAEIPGFVDSRLFGAMVPENVPVQALGDIERQANAGTRGESAQSQAPKSEAVVMCADCGAKRSADESICLDCGSRRVR